MNNLRYTDQGEIAFMTSTLGIVMNTQTKD
jgi:hypothetical protein